MKTFPLTIFIILVTSFARAQYHQGASSGGSFGKFVDIPVSHYTGVPQITVPLTTVREGPLSVPVALSYHGAGLKVGELASEVGAGFQLVGGGAIYRTVKGIVDEDSNSSRKGYYRHGKTLTGYTANHAAIEAGTLDGEADLFSFYMPGYSGKFYFEGGNGTNPGKVILVPHQDLKVEVGNIDCSPVVCQIESFTITAPDGTRYYFGKYDVNAFFSLEVNSYPAATNSNPLKRYAVIWYLAKIETYDAKHNIEYNYAVSNYFYETLAPSELKVVHVAGGATTQAEIPHPLASTLSGTAVKYLQIQAFSKVLQSITTRTQTVTFTHTDRTDVSLSSPDPKLAINGLTIEEGPAHCVKYEFTQSYFTDGASPTQPYRKRLKLDKVQKKSCSGFSSEPAWEFGYINPTAIPSRLTHAMDHWGFYNGKSTNNNTTVLTLIPVTQHILPGGSGNFNYGHSNRDIDSTYTKNGPLNQVTYPTGGYTRFIYEGNVAFDVNGQGVKTPITYLSTGQHPNTPHCNIPEYEAMSTVTLTQNQIDNGYFVLGVENHIGGCGGFTTLVKFDVVQNGVVKIHYEYNSTIPSQTIPIMLAGNGLTPGSTTFKLFVNNEGEGFADVYYFPTASVDAQVGGMRIKSIRTHDGFDSNRDITRFYHYRKTFTDPASSATYMGKPLYGEVVHESGGTPNTYTLMAEPNSLGALTSFEGYHIGYRRVEEEQNGNGTIVHTFRQESYENTGNYPAVGAPPRVLAGSSDSTKTHLAGGTLEAYQANSIYPDVYQNPSGINIRLTQVAGLSTSVTHTIYNNYTRNPFRPATTINYLDGVHSTQELDYTDLWQLQPTSIEFENSDGQEYTTRIRYTSAYEFGIVLPNYLRDHNLISLPYKTEIFLGSEQIDGNRTIWSFFDGNGLPVSSGTGTYLPYPYQTQRYERTWDENGALQTGSWRQVHEIAEYNPAFGFPFITREPSWVDRFFKYDAQANQVRDSTLNLVQKWEYFPGSSLLKSKTAPDGQKTSYTYDALLRPSTVLDECLGTLQTINYAFRDATNSHYNWIKTHTSFTPVTGSAVSVIEQFSYLDGLGREVQKVDKKHSIAELDIAHGVEYDNQGRIKRTFEPYLTTQNTGKRVTIPAAHESTLHEYRASPLNRTWKVTAPSWHPLEYFYESNNTGDLSGFAAGTLHKKKVKDGNGNIDVVLTDRKGRKLLQSQRNTTETVINDLKYQYDGKDRLILVLPPGTVATDAELIYTYTYDARDNVLTKKVPGKQVIQYWYNRRNLPAYTRDGYLTGANQWYATQYDDYGRESKTGFYSGPAPQHLLFNQATITDELTENIYGGTNAHEVDKIVTQRSKILGTTSWLETSLTYDVCGRVTTSSGNSLVNATAGSETHTFTYDGLDNLLKDIYTHQAFSTTKTITHEYTFDHVGRVDLYKHKLGAAAAVTISNVDFNHKNQLVRKQLAGFNNDALDYEYLPNGLFKWVNQAGLGSQDLYYEELFYDQGLILTGSNAPLQKNGNIANVVSQVKGHDRHVFGFQYDYLDRLTKASYLKLNGSSGGVIGSNDYNMEMTYDGRGNISTLKRDGHYRDGSQFIQSTLDDLAYTLGSGNRITSVQETAAAPGNQYGYRPNAGTYTYDNNGNVTFDPSSGATFTYNHLDLPVLADFGGGKTIRWTYDARGNMLRKLTEEGTMVLEDRRYVGQIEYGGNQIEMIYHEEGRLYNRNYDPQRLDLDGIILGTHTAWGEQIQSSALIQNSSNVDFVADQSVVLDPSFTIEPGSDFEAMIGPGPTGEDWRYDYCIKDYLGNTRVLFSDLDGNGSIAVSEIIGEYHYYPFGLKMEGAWGENTSLHKEKYQYNGIEYVPDHGLKLNVARYRMLDPSLGRWIGVDPKAELMMGYSPYAWPMNNPVTFNDPDGDIAPILLGAIIGAALHTGSHLVTNNFTFKNWNWGAFVGSVVAGGVGGFVGPALEAAHIGGFYGGAILGASTGFAHNLTSGIINGNLSAVALLKNTLLGAGIGGLAGGIDASVRGYRFLDGRSKIAYTKIITGTGSIADVDNPSYGLENQIANADVSGTSKLGVPGQRGHVTGAVNTSGFEGDLTIKIRAFPEKGETFFITRNGKRIFSTAQQFRGPIRVKAGQSLGWGIEGTSHRVLSDLLNTRAPSYILTSGQWRGWDGFLFWNN